MQANGRHRRPLWDVIKSIGGRRGEGGRAHEQYRGLHIRTYPVKAGVESTQDPTQSATNPPAENQRRAGCGRSVELGSRLSTRCHHAGDDEPRTHSVALSPDEETAREARRGQKEGALAADEGEASNHAATSRVRLYWDHSHDAEEAERRRRELQASPAFEAVVQRALANPVADNKLRKWPAYKADGELQSRYFKAYQGTAQHRLMKQVKRWQIQRERVGVLNARNWRSVLDLLDRATPDGESRHKRRMETVTLEGDLHATWKKPAGEVVLELMQRTGAHLQSLPGAGKAGTFQSVSLWGTPAQNEHARLLLPEFAEAVDTQQKPVTMYELKSEVSKDATNSSQVFGSDLNEKLDSAYWLEQDGIDDAELEMLEDALGDITNAPTRTPAPIRAVWAPSEIGFRSRPKHWNQLTFAAYVDALTTPIPRLAQRKLYGPQSPRSTQGHVENMTAELVRLFTGRLSAPFVSSAALDIAVRFFLKYNDFNSVRRVFLTLEDRQFQFTASNFDAFFDVAAREESVSNFIYTLRMMISKGFRPTARTWTAFHLLMAKRFPLETNVVAEAMRRKGLFANIDTVRAIAAGDAERALAADLSLGRSAEDFMQSCEARYGEPAIWLSVRFANKMSRVLLQRGQREEALAVVRRLEALACERNRQGATTNTLNTFLSSSLREGNMEDALAFLRIFAPSHYSHNDTCGPSTAPIGRFSDDKFAIRFDHITLGILFGLAWRQCFYNVARVIWRHACAHGKVSFRMQDAVKRSLRLEVKWTLLSKRQDGLPALEESSVGVRDRGLWNVMAGNFVVGVRSGLPQTASVSASSEVAALSSYKPFNADPTSQDLSNDDSQAQGKDDDESLAELLDPAANDPHSGSTSISPKEDASLTVLSKLHRGNDGADHRRRGRWAASLLHTDLNEAGSVQPANLLSQDLERAWQIDLLWREEGLGRMKRVWKQMREHEHTAKAAKRTSEGKEEEAGSDVKKDAEKLSFRRHVLAMFEEMLQKGVKVPMKIGDIAGVREAEGLTHVQYEP